MLGLLKTKELQTQDVFTENLLNLEDVGDSEASGHQIEQEEKNKRMSQTQLLMYQAKEEKLKATLAKAGKHVDTLKQYTCKVETTISRITTSQEHLLEKIKQRFALITEEITKYEREVFEEVQREMDIEKESKPFREEAAFVEEDLTGLQSIVQFAEDVLSSGSLETVAAVTDDVVKNVNKIIKRELKKLEWNIYDLNVPESNLKEQIRHLVGSVKKVAMTEDGARSNPSENETTELSSITIPELEEELSVRKPKVSTASNNASPGTAVHVDPDGIRMFPKYLADEYLVGTPEVEEMAPSTTDMWRGSPLALAGFDDDPRGSPPIPPRVSKIF